MRLIGKLQFPLENQSSTHDIVNLIEIYLQIERKGTLSVIWSNWNLSHQNERVWLTFFLENKKTYHTYMPVSLLIFVRHNPTWHRFHVNWNMLAFLSCCLTFTDRNSNYFLKRNAQNHSEIPVAKFPKIIRKQTAMAVEQDRRVCVPEAHRMCMRALVSYYYATTPKSFAKIFM